MSSRRLVPPVVAITFTPPMCLLTWMQIWLICRASSLVGTMTSAERVKERSPLNYISHSQCSIPVERGDNRRFLLPCMQSFFRSIRSSKGMRYAPLFPVPFLALARMSLPDKAMGMLSSYRQQKHKPPSAFNNHLV